MARSAEDNTTAPAPDDNYLETRNTAGETIQSHMLEQLNLLHLTESDQFIAACIVDGLDDDAGRGWEAALDRYSGKRMAGSAA